MNKNYRIMIAGLCILLLSMAACKKSQPIVTVTEGQICYFNVSEYLQNQLINLTNGRRSYMLIDSNLMNDGGIPKYALDLPYFDNQWYSFQFPNNQFNSQTPQQGWIYYMRIAPGAHFVNLTDTGGHHTLVSAGIKVVSSVPTTVYFADSLGFFRYWQVYDTVKTSSSGISLRVLDLGPDAGPVTVTIGNLPVPGITDSLVYGQVTGFVPYPVSTDTTLQIRVYALGDNTTVLASVPFNASPGHAYNLVLKGYLNNQSFPDPYEGGTIDLSQDFGIIIRQVN